MTMQHSLLQKSHKRQRYLQKSTGGKGNTSYKYGQNNVRHSYPRKERTHWVATVRNGGNSTIIIA
jgi:hypothetical protein